MGKNFIKFSLSTLMAFFSATYTLFTSVEVSATPVGYYERTDCPTMDLGIFGVQFTGSQGAPVRCVRANNDSEGIARCGGFRTERGGRYTAVNPGNPQYGGEGTLTTSPDGYYYCVPSIDANDKSAMCRRARAPAGFTYTWDAVGGDGNCLCSPGAGPNREPSVTCATTATTETPDDADAAAQTSPEETTVDQSDPTPTAVNTQQPNEFVTCVQNAARLAAICKNNADASQRECNPEAARNSTTGQIGDVLGAAGGMYAQANANTGAQAECFRAGVLANGAREVLNPSRESCRSSMGGCDSACGENKYDEYRANCGEILARTRGKNMDQLAQESGEEVSAEAAAFREHDEAIRDNYSQGREICQVGRRSQDTLNNLLTGLGNALQQSMICACQLSSSAVSGATPTTPDQANASGCNSIPNPDECATNPSLPNCNIYGSLNVCTPGAGYNAAACNCQMNPRSAGCPGATAGDGTSNFAGSAIGTARPGDTVSFAGLAGGGGGRGGGIDLSTSEDPEQLALGENSINRAADALPRTPGAGGAGGAGSGGGGAPAGEAGLLVDGEPKKGLSGLLTTLTNRAGRFFGARERTNGNIRIKPGSGKSGDPSMARFRPRGLASTGVGTKNMDIWRMMNMCVQGDTCKRNVNNYITGP